ncbi:hypothetical protein [Paraburkholderia sacchari]|uniref:hypothetical protein n=1 Tax=Paraburkholderia sacchari TaxID=159450 RepID=UPI0005433110|nr:hypothetical protein [Paraburkholderia sacchari]NLP65524.1 hypothetical protein [Paraburkholderia sacchari]
MKKDIALRVVWLALGGLLLKVALSAFYSEPLWQLMGRSAGLLVAFPAFLSLWSFAEAMWTKRGASPR